MSAQEQPEQPENNTPLSQQRWLIDVSKDENIPIYIRRGESVRLSMYHARFGRHMVIPEDYTAKLYYQTSGMEGWWEIPAEIMDSGAEGRVDVVWGPEYDNGADQYIFYVLITSPDSQVLCRGGGTLNMRYAPGAIPNTIPLPVPTLDFALTNYLNAPWVLPSEMDTAIAGLSDIYLGINDTADNAAYAAAADFATEAGHASSADNAGDADKVNGFTVEANVPAGAIFTDTIVDISGKADATDLTSHTGNSSNPHGVTPTQIGAITHEQLYTAINDFVTLTDLDHKADKSYVDDKVKTDVPLNAKFTETTINNKTGAIEKADIVALGIPAQDTVVDVSGKADKSTTYTKTEVDTELTLKADKTTVASDIAGLSAVYLGITAKADSAVSADNVNGFTVGVDVPAGAIFTDTIVDITGKADITYVNDRVKTPVPAGAIFTDTPTDISGKADKVLPYTSLTGANVTVNPSKSYVWETTAGTNLLTASGFTAGVDASCSMIITMFEGDTITASGLTFVDELEVGVNHCFVRQMPTGEPKLFVSYVGDYAGSFVDGLATGANDGTSWANAYTQIQPAINGATDGDLIMVKPGTYQPIDSLDKSITIESTGGAEVTIIDGNNTTRCAKLTNATLNGFKLTKGLAEYTGVTDDEDGRGGGSNGGTLNNCTLTGNTAAYGGGSYDSTLNNCTLSGNTASRGGGSNVGTLNNCILSGNTANQGGGSYYGTLNNCTLSGNTAGTYGGGSRNSELNNCTLTGNTAGNDGGGSHYGTLNNCTLTGNTAYSGGGSYAGTLNNCTLTGNTASIGGGTSACTLNNCTLSGNLAGQGGGSSGGTLNNCTLTGNTANAGGGGSRGSTLNNCIVWGNTSDIEDTANYDNSTFNYSNTSPLPAGTGNSSKDPKFISGSNLRLQADSPCIDAGSNALAVGDKDLDGNPRKVGTVDMGAYEYQGE